MIDVKGLSKSFGNHLVLDNIDQHISPGEKVVVIGPSGSGKSTFLRCLNLLEQPTAGTITFDGVVITDPRVDIDAIRRQMGMVFQHFNLFPNMTIRRNITLAPVRTGLMKQEEADAEAAKLLERVGLTEKADSYPAQLSGGQKQRISIARVFLKNPPILILDEATSSIDTRTERLIEKGMDRLMEGRTVFVIAHRLSTVRNSNAIMVLDQGEIIERGDHEDLLAQKGVYYRLYNGMFELA